MAFMASVGSVFYGKARHVHRPHDLYAYQIIGSTAKEPICRKIPIMQTVKIAPSYGGLAESQLDARWLELHPLNKYRSPPTAATTEGVVFGVSYTSKGEPHLNVPNLSLDYAHGQIKLTLLSLEEALAKREKCTFRQY